MKNLHIYSRGFSLVELMIAMVLGVVIVGGSLTIFTGVVRSASVNQAISNLQSNARFALDMIGRDVRSAGFIGCLAERDVALNVTIEDPPTSNLTQSAVTGYVVGATSWSPGLPTAYTAPTGVGAPVSGTHALSVQYAQFPGLLLDTSMGTNTGSVVFKRNDNIALRANQLMVLSDCSSADLFSISSVAKGDTTTTVSTSSTLAKRYTVPVDYPDNTRGMPFVSTIYYIGNTGRTSDTGNTVYSLYTHSYPYTTANPPVELVEGADQLVLEFGVRQTDGSLRYVTAGATGYQANGVETVRVGLLLSSLERFSSVDETRSYVLAGKSITATESESSDSESDDTESSDSAGSDDDSDSTDTSSTTNAASLTYTSDKRMRIPFNATFNVRNRNIQ